jgi:tellurite resistance protein TehA-like permease
LIPDIFRLISLSVAVFLWAVSFWFFCIAVVSVVSGTFIKGGLSFHLVWWAFVFPNVGFTIATIQIGKAVMSEGILWLGSVMTVLLVAVWMFVGVCHVRAVWRKKILWPGRDEDHDQ